MHILLKELNSETGIGCCISGHRERHNYVLESFGFDNYDDRLHVCATCTVLDQVCDRLLLVSTCKINFSENLVVTGTAHQQAKQ